MSAKRDIAVFVVVTLAWSVALAAFFWLLPKVTYNPADALITISAASVILAARGVSWRRRLIYAAVVLGIFLLVDYWFLSSGMMHAAFAGLNAGDTGQSVTAVAYMVFAQALPFVILVLFVGRDPSVLWRSTPKGGADEPSEEDRDG